MSHDTKRGERRLQKKRMIAKAKRILKNRYYNTAKDFVEHTSVRIADNLKACSCWMCGNPRHKAKHGDEPIYDRRHKIEEDSD